MSDEKSRFPCTATPAPTAPVRSPDRSAAPFVRIHRRVVVSELLAVQIVAQQRQHAIFLRRCALRSLLQRLDPAPATSSAPGTNAQRCRRTTIARLDRQRLVPVALGIARLSAVPSVVPPMRNMPSVVSCRPSSAWLHCHFLNHLLPVPLHRREAAPAHLAPTRSLHPPPALLDTQLLPDLPTRAVAASPALFNQGAPLAHWPPSPGRNRGERHTERAQAASPRFAITLLEPRTAVLAVLPLHSKTAGLRYRHSRSA